jgi:hypothetical protein
VTGEMIASSEGNHVTGEMIASSWRNHVTGVMITSSAENHVTGKMVTSFSGIHATPFNRTNQRFRLLFEMWRVRISAGTDSIQPEILRDSPQTVQAIPHRPLQLFPTSKRKPSIQY